VLDPGRSVPPLGGRDRGRDEPGHPILAQCSASRDERAARRHDVIDDHPLHPIGGRIPCASQDGLELAGGGPASLDSGQRRGVHTSSSDAEDGRHARPDAGAAQDPRRHRGQPVDVLTAPPAGHRRGGRHRHQADDHRRPAQAAEHFAYRGRECHSQHTGQIAPGPLLVRQHGGPDRTGVGRRDSQRRQAWWVRVRPVQARVRQRGPAMTAERPPEVGAAHAAARQQQVGQDIEHAATVVPRPTSRKPLSSICGQRTGLWMTSWGLHLVLVRLHRPRTRRRAWGTGQRRSPP
jgi:hypothetical protein